MRAALCIAILLAVSACSPVTETVTADGKGETGAEEVAGPADQVAVEVHFAELAETASETFESVDLESGEGLDVGPEPGQFGYPCDSNDDCFSGFCLETGNGQVCTMMCLDDCPADWTCAMCSVCGPDIIFFCVPRFYNICRPCGMSSECHDLTATGGECVDFGPAGSFCGAECAADGDCPTGYECELVETVHGEELNQCILKSGECECTQKYVEAGASTECHQANGLGVCYGERECQAGGLTECSAQVPQPEACNNLDDDCDGKVDEELSGGECLVMNSFGNCPGTEICDGGILLCQGDEAEAEQCDGMDNDCDGEVDETFPDSDGDGTADCLENDVDGDGVADILDNCPVAANPTQADYDLDTIGDVCDPDDDNDFSADTLDCAPHNAAVFPGADELCDGLDNDCNLLVDEGFADSDADGWKDCIDEDDDNDGILDGADCAPTDPNIFPGAKEICDGQDNDCDYDVDENFPDLDEDDMPDCIDPDIDGDGFDNPEDNCPVVSNQLQEDLDEDGLGDMCDFDMDGDGVPNAVDNCPTVFNPGQVDNENDTVGDACDPDLDNDNIDNEDDNCPFVYNEGQEDANEDGVGDACEADLDGDGVPNEVDCAPDNPAIFQGAEEICDGVDNDCDLAQDEGFPDLDADGVKDCIDADVDGDGDPNDTDCAPSDSSVNHAALEVCDAVDNDCNGKIDDGLGTLSCGKGACVHEVEVCSGGKVQWCDPYQGAAMEVCDGADNDCDGLVDEDQGKVSCGLGVCQHTVSLCSQGDVQECDPFEGATDEICDGQDNDCDGQTDEDSGEVACGKGQCFHSIAACMGGVEQQCNPFAGASPEVCDGIDNDCDDEVDEDLGTVSCGTGECLHDQEYCVDGKIAPCSPFAGVAPEECDGLDNDCNGLVDDGLGTVECGLGVCAHVVPACVEGQPSVCDPLAGAEDEVCDGLDNDCDGENDNGFTDTNSDGEADCVDDDDDGDGDPDAEDCASLDAAINHDADEICFNDIDENCDDVLNPLDVCVFSSCYLLRETHPELASGRYLIDPDGEGGAAAFEAGCDMVTDGGGWTLVLALRADTSNGWHMYDYSAAGLEVSSLPDQLAIDVAVTGVLPEAAINLLAAQNRQYLVDIANGLFKLTMNTGDMDFHQGIYKSSYSNPFVSTIVQALGSHVPLAEPNWQGTDNSMTTRSPCPGGYCHYIPDDVTGGHQWAHRHNVTPAAGSNGGWHYSKVFVR